MKLPRFRFTVRGLMVVVSIVAFSMGLFVWTMTMIRRSAGYRQRAEYHNFAQSEWTTLLETDKLLVKSDEAILNATKKVHRNNEVEIQKALKILNCSRFQVEARKRAVKYHSLMYAKYEHAARYPWLPVAPDPPEPE